MISDHILVNIHDKEIESEKWILDTPIRIQEYGKITIYILKLDDEGLLIMKDKGQQYALNSGQPITTRKKIVVRVPAYELKEECKQKYDELDEEVYEHPECWEEVKGEEVEKVTYEYQQFALEVPVMPGEINFMWKSTSEVKTTKISMIVIFRNGG